MGNSCIAHPSSWRSFSPSSLSRHLSEGMAESFDPARPAREMLPWMNVPFTLTTDGVDQIKAMIMWLISQAEDCPLAQRNIPSGRFQMDVPDDFTALKAGKIAAIRVVAQKAGLTARLITEDGHGSLVVPWSAAIAGNSGFWTVLLSKQCGWELDLLLSGLWRDLVVSGKAKVIEVKPREVKPPTAAPIHKPQGRRATPPTLNLPRDIITRVKLRGAVQPQKATEQELVQWATTADRQLIRERRRHPVRFFPRKLPEGYKASETIRAWVKKAGLPPLPATGLTIVRPHERGKDDPTTVARPIHASGLALVSGLLTQLHKG